MLAQLIRKETHHCVVDGRSIRRWQHRLGELDRVEEREVAPPAVGLGAVLPVPTTRHEKVGVERRGSAHTHTHTHTHTSQQTQHSTAPC